MPCRPPSHPAYDHESQWHLSGSHLRQAGGQDCTVARHPILHAIMEVKDTHEALI